MNDNYRNHPGIPLSVEEVASLILVCEVFLEMHSIVRSSQGAAIPPFFKDELLEAEEVIIPTVKKMTEKMKKCLSDKTGLKQ